MRRIVIGEFVSLDGVSEAPEQWTMQHYNDEVGGYIASNYVTSDALLLGRVTYEAFAATFATMAGDQADAMNNFPKYVVSNTLPSADWNNTTLITGDAIAAITKLKQQPGKDITISGSIMLAQSLMKHNLVDEYALLVYPVVLGCGKQLFPDGMARATLKLIEARPFSNGVVLMRYAPAAA
ncbi:MAG: dihydrofolate reductase [Anaerolineae bacterium]|nr:dihydrofolate reductase [Anaerolineae bacterium]